jgi:microcin C transport system permease protein
MRKGYTRFFLEPQKPAKVIEKILPPSHISYPMRPVKEHPFGLDAGGRDVFTRVIHGMRIALIFGLALTLSGMFFGLVIGALEGYFGGKIDILLQRFTEIWSAIPFLYVMIFIGSTLGRSFGVLLFCYAIFQSCSSFLHAYFARTWAVGFYGCMLSAMVFSAFLFSLSFAIYILLFFKKVLHN